MSTVDPQPPKPGRQRDSSIDEAVMRVALEHLSTRGISGFSITAVAAEAGTTRPAVYRRWRDKIELITASVAWLADAEPPHRTGDAYADLLAEVEHFRAGIKDPGALSLAALMVTDSVDAPIRDSYRVRIAEPLWRRIGDCLREGVACGCLPASADVDLGVSLLAGSWYAYAWAGATPPDNWVTKAVDATWVALGGASHLDAGYCGVEPPPLLREQ